MDFQENTLDGSLMHVTSMVIFQSSIAPVVQDGAMGTVPVKIGRSQTLKEVKLRKGFIPGHHGKGIKGKRKPETDNLNPDWLVKQDKPKIPNLNLCWMLSQLCPTKVLEVDKEIYPEIQKFLCTIITV